MTGPGVEPNYRILAETSNVSTSPSLTSTWRYSLCSTSASITRGEIKESRLSSRLLLQSRGSNLKSKYSATGLLRLPSVFSGYAISFNRGLNCFKLSLPFLNPSLSFQNIALDDSEFLQACELGNFEVARSLALKGKGRPTDVDERGRTAIFAGLAKTLCLFCI